MDLTLDPAVIGAALKDARQRRELKGRELARLIGMDHADLLRIERGRATTLARYTEIAAALGLTMRVRIRRAA